MADNRVGELALPPPDKAIFLEDHTPLYPDAKAAEELLHQALRDPRFVHSVPEDIRCYTEQYNRRPLKVIASLDRARNHGLLLHISASYAHQTPRWKVMRMLRDVFFPPDVDTMLVLPRHQDYVNAMEFCLHIWQMPMSWRVM